MYFNVFLVCFILIATIIVYGREIFIYLARFNTVTYGKHLYMLFAGREVRIGKNCARGLGKLLYKKCFC